MKKPFCAAPWNYLHVRADQRFGACCISRMYYDPDTNNTFDEHWNSPEMKALRVTLMSGKPDPKICYRCLPENCNSTALSYKGYNEKAAPHLTEMMDKTLEDGTTTYFPRTFDFRTDLCNFKCRMCYDTFSSKIKTEHIKYGLETTPRGKVDSLEATGLTDDSISKLEYITWAGGEPFMSPVYWEVIDRLIELGNTDLKMFYYTNMSFPGKTIDRAVNTLCQFSRVFLSGSLDGTGEDVEYIREGVKYEEFVSNLKYLQCSLPLATFSISYTATSMGLHTLGETLNLCDDLGIKFDGRVVTISDDHHLSLCALSHDGLEKLLANAIEKTKGRKIEKIAIQYANFLRNKHKSIKPNLENLYKQEMMRGKVGYYMSRMKGFINE